ncbi:MAG: hypothetical protein H6873_04050 [Hyphomicrobiaceae bacterium]|nr:hypothetical protein [Hyphomicrobiaceae bacterium]
MDFIFMLTRGDKTVKDCLDVIDLIEPLGLTHVGFKDVGVDPQTLQALTDHIHAMGAISYMEVVSESAEACLNSARVARDLGVQRLLGGTDVAAVSDILQGTGTAYFPFPGFPSGHPTRLGGQPADVMDHCTEFMRAGCAGADLLAFRATEANPLDLIRAARKGLGDGYLIVAGSISSADRIRAVADAGADAFTIGSAIFDGSYNPRLGSTLRQLEEVLQDCKAA